MGRKGAQEQSIKKLKDRLKVKKDQRVQKLVEGGMGVKEATDLAEQEVKEEEKTEVESLEVRICLLYIYTCI
jgi:hypothetical protein